MIPGAGAEDGKPARVVIDTKFGDLAAGGGMAVSMSCPEALRSRSARDTCERSWWPTSEREADRGCSDLQLPGLMLAGFLWRSTHLGLRVRLLPM